MNGTITRRAPSLPRWMMPAAVTAGLVLLAALIALVVSPPGRRLLANPTGVEPVTGVTSITVRGDPAQNHVFDPPVVQAPAGTALTWTFADTGPNGGEELVPHDVAFDDERSPLLASGTYSRQFDTPGTYRYVCSLHPFMEGVVIVTAREP